MDKDDYIDKFFEEYGRNKVKEVNGFCIKGKKKCPYTNSGSCWGLCLA